MKRPGAVTSLVFKAKALLSDPSRAVRLSGTALHHHQDLRNESSWGNSSEGTSSDETLAIRVGQGDSWNPSKSSVLQISRLHWERTLCLHAYARQPSLRTCREPVSFSMPVPVDMQEPVSFSTSTSTHKDSPGSHAGMYELKLAQTGEGIAECELMKWFVKEGDEVKEFQPVCEVQSDKATVEITSRYNGTVSRIHFMPGNIVKVGETLMDLLPAGAVDGLHPPATAGGLTGVTPAGAVQSEAATSPLKSKDGPVADSKVLTTPAVRHLARGYGIRLSDIEGTGKEGRVMKEDLLKYVAERDSMEEDLRTTVESQTPENPPQNMHPAATPGSTPTPLAEPKAHPSPGQPPQHTERGGVQAAAPRGHPTNPPDTIIPIRGYRRTMAKTMAAANAVPHFLYCEEVEMGALVELRTSLKEDAALACPGAKLTYLPFLIKALSASLVKFPLMNSTVNADVSEILCKGAHNIGVAMAAPNGLVVPNIKNCQNLSILQICEELARLQRLASANQLPPADVSGGTITLSNIGTIGGTYAAPLLNLPEVAIVAVGRIQDVPRFDLDGQIRCASLMNVSWAADHRVVDGATVASFCKEWKGYLEQPERLLLHLK